MKQTIRTIIMSALLIGVCTTALAQEKKFTIFTIPDTQRGLNNIAPMMQWIGQNKAALNVVGVLSLGDMTDDNSGHWDPVINGYDNVLWQTYGIPFAPCMGNHDSLRIYGPPNWPDARGMENVFPTSYLQNQGMIDTTMEGTSENASYKVSVYGINLTMVTIADYEYGDGRNARINWAKGVFNSIPSDDIGIFFPHDPGWIGSFNGSAPNIDFMMCGHHGNNASHIQYSNFKYWLTGHYANFNSRAIAYTFYPDQNLVTIKEMDNFGNVNHSFPDVTLVMNPTSTDGTPIYGGTPPVIPGNSAEFISQSISDTMDLNGTYPATVTLKNTGTNTWTSAGGYNLGSQNPQDNTTWGMDRVSLPAGNPDVVQNEQVTFSFNVTAPPQAGVYDFQWRMVDDSGENIGWFGYNSENLSVTVGLTDTTANPGAITSNGQGVQAHEDEAKAIDDNTGSKFLSNSQSAYLQYQYASSAKHQVVSYSLTSANDVPGRDPVDVTLSGSQDGSNWTTLDTQTGIEYASRFEKQAFNISNTTAYEYYRLDMANNGSEALLQLAEIELLAANNSAPQITSTPPDSFVDVGEAYSYTITATDAESDPITLSCETDLNGSWLSFGGATLSGTPAVGDIGVHSIVLRASDATSYTEENITITVSALGNDAPMITSTPDTGLIEGEAYSYTITAEDVDGDSLTYTDVMSPAWLTLSGSVLSGTAPSGNSLDLVELAVSDGTVSVTQSFNVVVFETPLPPNLLANGSFETGDTTSWTVTAPTEISVSTDTATDETYALKLVPEADGYVPPTSQSVSVQTNTNYVLNYDVRREAGSAGALVGRVIDDTNRIVDHDPTAGWEMREISFNSGTNTSVNVQFWMDGGATNISYLDHIVFSEPGGGNVAPVITSTPVTDVIVNVPYSYTLSAADAENHTLTFSSVSIPSGFSLNAGVLTGTPTVAETLNVSLTVSDGPGGSSTQSFDIVVSDPIPSSAYDAWAISEGVDALNPTNLLEYAMDGDASVVGDTQPTIQKAGGTLTYVHPEHAGDLDLVYTVQSCDDLTVGNWTAAGVTAVTNVTGGDYNVVTNTIPTTGVQTYLRLHIQNP